MLNPASFFPVHATGISVDASDLFQITVEVEMRECIWACCPKTGQRAFHQFVLNLM